MTSRDFVYWLQGYFELTCENGKEFEGNISEDVARKIQRHLHMVFKHEIDPSMGTAAHQAALTAAHQGGAASTSPKATIQESLAGLGTLTGYIQARCPTCGQAKVLDKIEAALNC